MYVISRKVDESIVVNGNIVVMVVGILDGKVRIGVQAPREVSVDRMEVRIAKRKQRSLLGLEPPP